MRRLGAVRRAAVLLAVAIAVLGLSGCFNASQDVRVRANGSGSVTIHAEVNKKALAAILKSSHGAGGLGGAAALTPFRSVDRTFPDGTKVRAVDRADRSTLDASFDFSGPDEYKQKLRQVNAALVSSAPAAVPDDGSIQIRRTGDRMEVALDFGSFTEGAGDLDLASLSRAVDPADLPTVVVTITMPGSILTTNGRTQGRTATWDLLSRGSPTTLTASSTVADPGPPLWPVLLGGGVILLVLGVSGTFFFSQRKHAARFHEQGAPEAGGAWAPTGRAGTEAFFPPLPGPPPREATAWPVPPPAAPNPPPPPRPAASWPTPEPAASATEPSVPSEPQPVQSPPPASGPAAPAAAGPGAAPVHHGPRPPGGSTDQSEATAPVPQAADAEPEQRRPEPLPWRVAGPAPASDPTTPDPVVRPPAPAAGTTMSLPEPGWYADPAGGSGLRFWDGLHWTQHTT